jgi:hypothetical protein
MAGSNKRGSRRRAAVGERAERLTPHELGRLAGRLSATQNEREAARLKARLKRGFYGN